MNGMGAHSFSEESKGQEDGLVVRFEALSQHNSQTQYIEVKRSTHAASSTLHRVDKLGK